MLLEQTASGATNFPARDAFFLSEAARNGWQPLGFGLRAITTAKQAELSAKGLLSRSRLSDATMVDMGA